MADTEHQPTSTRSSFNNYVLASLRECGDNDPWGEAMGWMFAVCSYLYAVDSSLIRPEWEFRPSLFERADDTAHLERIRTDSYELDMLVEEAPDLDEVVRAGRVLNRYTDLLRSEGHSY